jgi:enoyl-CoA hydratase/carnithine racemase
LQDTLQNNDGPITTLRINRPAQENRLNLTVLDELCSALSRADADARTRVVVLRGTGETFCCGGDLDEFAAGDAVAYRKFGERFAALHLAVAQLSKPVLAAVNGDARAGGLSLLATCDLAVARESALFAMPEIHAGVWPVMAMVSLNPLLTRKRAFELYYFGERFDAREAQRLGLVNWIAVDGEFEGTVQRRAEQLAALPRSAVAVGRSTFFEIGERSRREAFAYSRERLVELLKDPEVARALAGRAGGTRGTSGTRGTRGT